MKQLTCEMCGGTDIIKQDGSFLCQTCGMKYSIEEAKKMMIEGTVDVSGSTIKVDVSDELRNLYELARRAKAENNNENAAKYYEMILVKDSNSWEATFYTIYFQSMSCKIAGIQSAAIAVKNCEDTVLRLVKENVLDAAERKEIINEISTKIMYIAELLKTAAVNHYMGISLQIRSNYIQEMVNNCCAARDILYEFGDCLIKHFGDEYALEFAVPCWKVAIHYHKDVMIHFSNKEINKDIINVFGNKIKKYDSTYEIPQVDTSSGGCYVATAVYGSYDCPQVWTLRRYRDNILAKTWYGKAFIKTYYAISPAFVKWFGHTQWFRNLWKGRLDRLVDELQAEGIASTPYEDREW